MSVASCSGIPRKRTREERELANREAEEDEQKENLASTSERRKEDGVEYEEEHDDRCSCEDSRMEHDDRDEKSDNSKSSRSADLGSSTRRKLTPKRTTHYRRPNKESLPVDASNLLVDEEDLFYGPQLLLDESLLTNGGDIPVFNADDIDNVLADLEFLNLHQ